MIGRWFVQSSAKSLIPKMFKDDFPDGSFVRNHLVRQVSLAVETHGYNNVSRYDEERVALFKQPEFVMTAGFTKAICCNTAAQSDMGTL